MTIIYGCYTSKGLSPASAVYSASKLLGEALCALYARQKGVEFNVLRFSTVYGERQHWRAVNAAFMAGLYEQVRRGERPVVLGDGSEVHDYIYVTDVAQACVLAMTSERHGEVMNVATGTDTTLKDLAEIIVAASGADGVSVEYRPDTREVKSSVVEHLSNSRQRASEVLGWSPEVGMEEGVARYVRWRESQASPA